MGSELDYQDDIDDADGSSDEVWSADIPRGPDRDCRRVIEQLREERRLRELLSDFDFEEDEFEEA
jgi:hypothetical protein